MRAYKLLQLAVCVAILSISATWTLPLHAQAPQGGQLECDGPYPVQGNPALCPNVPLPSAAELKCGSIAFPGLSTVPLRAHGDCVFVDNDGTDCRNSLFFIPAGSVADWNDFKQKIQAGQVQQGQGRLSNVCLTETFTTTVCGQPQQPPITRNGDTATFQIGERTETFTCEAGPGCVATWTMTQSSGECPPVVAGRCGSAADPANRFTSVPRSGLCAQGELAGSVAGSGPWSWRCNGLNGGDPSPTCVAIGPDAACGPANGRVLSAAPNLSDACNNSSAFASGPTRGGNGAYSWVCAGQFGGANSAGCASKAPTVDRGPDSDVRLVLNNRDVHIRVGHNKWAGPAYGGRKNIPAPHVDLDPYSYEGTARYMCARHGLGVVHDFSGTWGKRKGGGCDDSDVDIYGARYTGPAGDYAAMKNPNNYVISVSGSDTNCTGDMGAALCSGPEFYVLTSLNTLAGPGNTDPQLAEPPVGLDVCPAGVNLALGVQGNPGAFVSLPTYVPYGTGGNHSTYKFASTMERERYGANTRYGAYTLSKYDLNCYQRTETTVTECPVNPATGQADADWNNPLPYANPYPAGQVCLDPIDMGELGYFEGACYICNQPINPVTYYSLYTATTEQRCMETQINQPTGNILSPADCNGAEWGGVQWRQARQNIGGDCDNDEAFTTYCVPRGPCDVPDDLDAQAACDAERERERCNRNPADCNL